MSVLAKTLPKHMRETYLKSVPRLLLPLVLTTALQAQWRSALYPENWQRPNETTSFYADKLIQDFSYAGYKSGVEAIPSAAATHNAVSGYGADPTGTNDSTVAIQNAITAAGNAGGGVVFLPAGTYKISPQGTNAYCLRISKSNVVLRGAGSASTFLLNTQPVMRSKSVVEVSPTSTTTGSAVLLTADLTGPTRRIPVATPSTFAVGDVVMLKWDLTDAWVVEHNQQTWWNATNGYPAAAEYLREVVAVDQAQGWIEVDVPTRYTMKTRDNASVTKLTGFLSGAGVEALSIGNVQHAGTTWGENDYSVAGTAAYDVHGSWLLEMRSLRDCWATDVKSYQPTGNTTTAHMLSNGVSLNDSIRVTVKSCWMGRPQYGGGGGNGYMYRLQNSNNCLVQSCTSDLARHGFVISHAGTSGNVFLQCDDRETGRALGSSSTPYTTGGSGSDNHMHFSHSNLWDSCHAHNSFYTAHHRTTSGTVPHGLTSAHAVYWNTSGSGTRYDDSANPIVRSEQGRYGYVIGTKATSGTAYFVSNPTGGNTTPADHVEGVNTGATLSPQSLYLDQLERRLRPVVTYKGNGSTGGTVPTDANNPYTPGTTVTILGAGTMVRAGYTFAGWNTLDTGTGNNYSAGNTFTIDNHLTLYAKWTPATYLVTLDRQTGTGGSGSVTATYGAAMPAATAPTRSGYVFGGYYSNTNGAGTQYYTSAMASATNWNIAAATTLYAKWTPGTSTVIYDGNGATTGSVPVDASSPYSNGATVTVLGNTGDLVRTGYTFAGWNTAAIGGGTSYSAGATFTINANTMLYAQWAATSYTLSFDGNGGNTPASQSVTFGSTYGTLPTPGRTGYTFKGWFTAASGGTEVTSSTTVTTADHHTLHARWNALPSANAGNDAVVAMSGFTLWTPAPASLAAWYDASDSNGLSIIDGKVSQWSDKSDKGNHAAQGTATVRPASGSVTIGGKNTISFRVGDGTNKQFLSAPDANSLDLDASGGANVFAVMRSLGYISNTATSNGLLAKGDVLAASVAYGIRVSSSNALAYKAGSSSNPAAGDYSGQNVLFAGTRDDATKTASVYMNGTLGNSVTSATAITSDNTNPLYIGRDSASSRYADVDFGEIIIMGGALSSANRQQIEGYLAHKWGLQNTLPNDHPYKSIAPGTPYATASLDGTATDAEGDSLTFNWSVVSGNASAVSFANATAMDTTATITQTGTYTLRLTVSEGANQVSDDVVITVKAVPTVSAWPMAANITEGQALSAAALSGGTASVAGSFSFTNPATVPAVGTASHAVTFTPTDSANYMSVSGAVNVTVLSAFDSWADANGTGSETFTGDANSDGVADGLTWLLGATSPTQSAQALLPSAQEINKDLTVGFKLRKAASRGSALLQLQTSTSLAANSWATVTVPDTSGTVGGVVFVITPVDGQDYNQVQATVPASAAAGTGKIFVRLSGEGS